MSRLRIRPRASNQKLQGECAHPETTVTTNFGLERTLCLSCGRVEMRYLERAATAGASPGNDAVPGSKVTTVNR